jgi:hypothetical protein
MCSAADIVAAVGLSLADLFPVRLKPQTEEERRAARRHAREAQWGAALDSLALESGIVRLGAAAMMDDKPLDWDEWRRVIVACDRIDDARAVLREPPRWRPEVAR